MPIYKYVCKFCGFTKEEFVFSWDTPIKCDNCDNEMAKHPSIFKVDVFPPEGIHLKHVSPTGETFHSKSEMKRYAKEHDIELGALL